MFFLFRSVLSFLFLLCTFVLLQCASQHKLWMQIVSQWLSVVSQQRPIVWQETNSRTVQHQNNSRVLGVLGKVYSHALQYPATLVFKVFKPIASKLVISTTKKTLEIVRQFTIQSQTYSYSWKVRRLHFSCFLERFYFRFSIGFVFQFISANWIILLSVINLSFTEEL